MGGRAVRVRVLPLRRTMTVRVASAGGMPDMTPAGHLQPDPSPSKGGEDGVRLLMACVIWVLLCRSCRTVRPAPRIAVAKRQAMPWA